MTALIFQIAVHCGAADESNSSSSIAGHRRSAAGRTSNHDCEELAQAIRDTAHILWPDEHAFIGTYRPMLGEEIVQKDILTKSTSERS